MLIMSGLKFTLNLWLNYRIVLFGVFLGGIIDKCFDEPEKTMFFVRKTLENGWNWNVLLNFIDTDLLRTEREGNYQPQDVTSCSVK